MANIDPDCTYVKCDHRRGQTTGPHCLDKKCPNWVNKCDKHRTDRKSGSTMPWRVRKPDK
jgi:hypothetical protein